MPRKRPLTDIEQTIADIDEQIAEVTLRLEPLTQQLSTLVHARKYVLDRLPVRESMPRKALPLVTPAAKG